MAWGTGSGLVPKLFTIQTNISVPTIFKTKISCWLYSRYRHKMDHMLYDTCWWCYMLHVMLAVVLHVIWLLQLMLHVIWYMLDDICWLHVIYVACWWCYMLYLLLVLHVLLAGGTATWYMVLIHVTCWCWCSHLYAPPGPGATRPQWWLLRSLWQWLHREALPASHHPWLPDSRAPRRALWGLLTSAQPIS